MSTAHLSPVSTAIDYEKDGKQSGYLKVPYSRNDSAWGAVMIPITVIKNGHGPTAYLNAGSHGGEYEGPVVLTKLAQELQPPDIQGRVIIIPALNLPAVTSGGRLSPIDNKDMNRVFPGQWDGTISQVIAHYINEVILSLCDAVLDIHSGGYSLDLAPYISMHFLDNPIQMEQTFAALKAFHAPFALIMNEFTGAGLLDYAVEGMGKIFLCAELGGGGRLSGMTVQIADTGTRNFLKHFGILHGDLDMRQVPTRFMAIPDSENYHISLSNGIFEPFIELGQEIERGEALGQIHFVDQPQRIPDDIIAQRNGTVLGIRSPSTVAVGDCVVLVAEETMPDIK